MCPQKVGKIFFFFAFEKDFVSLQFGVELVLSNNIFEFNEKLWIQLLVTAIVIYDKLKYFQHISLVLCASAVTLVLWLSVLLDWRIFSGRIGSLS